MSETRTGGTAKPRPPPFNHRDHDPPREPRRTTAVKRTNIQFTERKQLSLALHRILPDHAGGAL
jgi:hypothetical protein